MGQQRQTTVRFTEEVYGRLEEASRLTGLPINSIVVVAALEWLETHRPDSLEEPPRSGWLRGMARLARPGLRPGRRHPVSEGALDLFDSFTAPARGALARGQSEAEAFGHGYIGTEHLLLGLAVEAAGIAACALARSGVDQEALRARLRDLVPAGKPTPRLLPTSRTKRVLELAVAAAEEAGCSYVGTEHLLASLLKEGEGIGARIVLELAPEKQVRAAIAECVRERGREPG